MQSDKQVLENGRLTAENMTLKGMKVRSTSHHFWDAKQASKQGSFEPKEISSVTKFHYFSAFICQTDMEFPNICILSFVFVF